MISSVVVLGGGSAGLMAALTLKRKLPQLQVRVIRSPDIGVIGVGEGTTAAFPRHFFEYLNLDAREFYADAQPTWKLGIRFLWGPRGDFFYTFGKEYEQRWPELRRNVGFYHDENLRFVGPISALMAHDKAFAKNPDGMPNLHRNHAFHIENIKLVGYLETVCRKVGVSITDGNMTQAEIGAVSVAGREERGVTALLLASGERVTADLFIDASGFRSELLGRALGEPVRDFSDALFCDRAVIGGWTRTDEPIRPYTVAETMESGWCWQIEHEHWINRGYVYSSRFIDDDAARVELLAKNPKISNEPRVVKFRSFHSKRIWVGNVVGIGNASGFVEPLEATSLQVISVQTSTLADALVDALQEPTRTMIDCFNRYHSTQWNDIRDFLAVHYAFNTRLDTPFWQTCRRDIALGEAQQVVDFYQENGPSALLSGIILHPTNSFGLEGYLALLVGQNVPYAKRYHPSIAEAQAWKDRCAIYNVNAQQAMSVKECLESLRKVGWIKSA
ncbi:MAG: tryptophan-5-halogenase [Chthoniobacteraceae bacterium]|nr:tryptophan-5-halogenase [Chthoniobacteraceae bacterium]